MNANTIRLTTLSLLISFTLAGLSSQIGVLVNPLSARFGISQTDAAAQFSWLNSGVLLGNLLALSALRFIAIKTVVIGCYSILLLGAVLLYMTASFNLVPVLLAIIGICAGIGVCASSTIIANIWHEKQRQGVLVAQDAVFNTGGMLFPMTIAALLAMQFDWSWGFLTIALVGLVIAVLASFSTFDFAETNAFHGADGSDWPIGLIVAGIGLFATLMCLVAITIWVPNLAEGTFGATQGEAASIVSKIYRSALVGSLVFTALVMRIDIRVFVAALVFIGCVTSYRFAVATSLDGIEWAAYGYGIAIAALYHSFIAWGLSYTEKPNYAHVTFLYVCPGVGGALAPYLSSQLVDTHGMASVFFVCAGAYAVTFLLIFGVGPFARKQLWRPRNLAMES